MGSTPPQKHLRKTKFCMYHLQGVCQFGSNCAFAHSLDELQGGGQTEEEDEEEEIRPVDSSYKTTLCMWHEKGRCWNEDQCRFAHGVRELRSKERPLKVPAEKG